MALVVAEIEVRPGVYALMKVDENDPRIAEAQASQKTRTSSKNKAASTAASTGETEG